jgi:amino acid adenylation domain-containing protein
MDKAIMQNAVAIIGMSGIYPDAEDLDQFYKNLAAGRDSVRDISDARKKDVGVEPSWRCQPAAMLQRVDQFDHEFFQISRKEAEYMDPHQRLLLQLACAAIENAGYSLVRLRKTRTAVYVSASGRGYAKLLETFEPAVLTGNLPAALAGRIAYHLDLRGPAMVFDTACSSSLVAIAEAYRRLLSGDVDFALAGGMNVFFMDDQLDSAAIEIVARDGKSKAFDAAADGAGWGEGGGFVLMRSLQKALENGDIIHAVIRGAAVNQDGGRSNGMAAPSPEGQCEVILQTWREAQIAPRDLSHMEAHGTGTKLGDPIEVQGITSAFSSYTADRGFCAIGSVKTNIGHLVGSAGIAGLTKLILELKHKELFPTLHFQTPNPYIDFQASPLLVNTELRPWVTQGNRRRLAGVSSFGLSGTNAHLVVEEAPERLNRRIEPRDIPVPIKVSAKSPSALKRNILRLAQFLRTSNDPLPCIAYTLNWGRDDYCYRHIQISDSKENAIQQLEEAAEQALDCRKAAIEAGLVLLLADDAVASSEQIAWLSTKYRVFADTWASCQGISRSGDAPSIHNFAFLYAIAKMWSSLGFRLGSVIGCGSGKIVAKALSGNMQLEEAIHNAQNRSPESGFDRDKLNAIVQELSQNGPLVFLEAGENSSLSQALRENISSAKNARHVSTLKKSEPETVLAAFAQLYREGVAVEWDRFYRGHAYQRIELPTYSFDQTRCWIVPTGYEKTPQQTQSVVVKENYGVLAVDGSETERKLARMWGGILKKDRLTPDDDYFALGGNSLDAIQILNRIRSEFGVSFEFEDLYQFPVLKDLAQKIDSQKEGISRANPLQETRQDAATPESGQVARDLPLSSGQERLWFLNQMEPGNPFYNLSFAIHIKGHLDIPVLESSFNEINRRHQILRTVFPQKDGVPVQNVSPAGNLSLPKTDLRSLPEELAHDRSLEMAGEEARCSFDLSQGPLWRVSLIQVSEQAWLLVIVMHHIVSDAWSIGLLLRELATLYQAFSRGKPSPLPSLRMQYGDYTQAQRGLLENGSFAGDLEYWKQNLRDARSGLELPTDFARPAKRQPRGARGTFVLPSRLIEELKALSVHEEATLFMILLTAFQALLARYSGPDDICVGVPVAGRNSPEVEGLIGFFVNTLVIRGDASGNPAFNVLLGRIRKAVLGAFSHQRIPFEEVVKALAVPRNLDHHPLFQVMFMLQNIAMDVSVLPDLEWHAMDVETGTTQFDMVFSLMERPEGLAGTIDYNAALFEAITCERLAKHFGNLLYSIVNNPGQKLSELSLLDTAEQAQLLGDGRGPETRDLAHGYIADLFEAQALLTPTAPALIHEGREWTYQEVDQSSNRIGRYLRRLGVGPEVVVAISLERSSEFILATLGVLKAGGAYLALDVECPAERAKYMVENAGAAVMVMREPEGNAIPAAGPASGRTVISLREQQEAIAAESPLKLETCVHGENLAYVVYTSGSSGSPKGVMVSHDALKNFVLEIATIMRLTAADRVLQFASVSFDASNVQIYPALATGAAIVLHPAPNRLSNRELWDFCEQQNVTVLDLPGAFWRQWVEDLAAHDARPRSSVRLHMTGGENVPWPSVESWRQVSSPGSSFISSYGPTEATVTTTVFAASHDALGQQLQNEGTGNVPLGTPMPNASVYVLDQHMQLLPAGCVGELYIAGRGLARGYMGRPDLTAAGFVPDPFAVEPGARMYRSGDFVRLLPNATIQFLGRVDQQFKIRGFRIEPAEIEAALRSYPGVRETVVVARPDTRGMDCLVAYLEAAEDALSDNNAIRAFLRSKLPGYMIPTHFVVMPALPVTQNAKIDRGRLPELMQADNETFTPPASKTERRLAELWCEILGKSQIGSTEDFFAIGGHSLLATQVISRVRDIFGVDLPLRTLFEGPTIADLARRIELSCSVSFDRFQPIERTGRLPLSFAQQRFWFLEQLEPSCGKFNIANVWLMKGCVDIPALQKSFDGLVQRHESLRTVFPAVNGEPVQQVLEPGPANLEVIDLRELQEPERQRRSDQIIQLETHFSFDLERGPLMRAKLVRMQDEVCLLLVTAHHIVFDGWSLYVLIDDLSTQYQAFCFGREPELPALTIQYGDYSHWQRQQLSETVIKEHVSYWRRRLGNDNARNVLPTDVTLVSSSASGRYAFAVSFTLKQALEKLGREESATLFVVMLAAFSSVLHRYSGQQEMVIGVDLANRTRVETERVIGCFFNHVPLCIDFSGEPSFREMTRRTREFMHEAFSHQDLPFDLLVQHLQPARPKGASPFFQVLVVYQNIPEARVQLPDLTISPVEVSGGSPKLDLTLFLRPGDGGIEGVFEYDTGILLPETVEQMARLYLNLLEAVVRDGDRRVRSIFETSSDSAPVDAFKEALT